MKSRSKVFKLFDSKAFRVVISVVAAFLIWMYITSTQEDEIKREINNVQVVFSGAETMQESKGFVVTDVDTETVTVIITGTRQNIGKLDSTDLKAVIDLSQVTKTGNNLFRFDIEYPDSVDASSVTVENCYPENILFSVSKLSTKTVPVKGAFLGGTAEGYVAETLEFEPETITLSGPESELSNIEYVWATIGGEEVKSSRTVDVSFTYMDSDDNQLNYDDITHDYDSVSVTLPISLKKEVPLSVSLIQGAGATDSNTIVTVEPSTLTISGDPAIVEGINKILVATIDLTDFPNSLSESYPIVLDNEVQNVTGITEAAVTVKIIGLQTKKLSVENLSCINVAEGYTAEILTESLEVTIRAAEDVLSEITTDNLRAVADLTDISSTGDVSVPVKIYINGFPDAGAIGEGEYKITVNIK
ncbi:MAG: hypothetical protein EOM54_03725 [Clostridia bacterium]|nr:hypothetical protein [Clostridia bacterium]